MTKPQLTPKQQAEIEIRAEMAPQANDYQWAVHFDGARFYARLIEERIELILERNRTEYQLGTLKSQDEKIQELAEENEQLKKELETSKEKDESLSIQMLTWLREHRPPLRQSYICNTHQHLKPCPQCALVNQVEERGRSVGGGKGYVPAGSAKVEEEPTRLDCGNPTCIKCNPKLTICSNHDRTKFSLRKSDGSNQWWYGKNGTWINESNKYLDMFIFESDDEEEIKGILKCIMRITSK